MAPKVVKGLGALQEALATYARCPAAPVLAIDGMAGSGKSYLASRLVACIRATHLSLDDFLIEKKGGFLDHLRYDELATAVDRARQNGAVIIEGVCLQEVLERLGVKPTVHIYVKYLVAGFIWQPERVLSMDSATAALAREEEEARWFAEMSDKPVEPGENYVGGLDRELVAYHYRYRPHERADIIYERSDEPA